MYTQLIRGLLAGYNIADNDLPSKDIEKLTELWQQVECLWNISLEGLHKNYLTGNQLTGSKRLLTINT